MALRRSASKASKPMPTNAELFPAILETLRASAAPMTQVEIAAAIEADLHLTVLGLCALKQDGRVWQGRDCRWSEAAK